MAAATPKRHDQTERPKEMTQPMRDKLVTVFGGAGFLGRYLVQRLAHEGARVRVAMRRPDEGLFLKPLGAVLKSTHLVPDFLSSSMDTNLLSTT